MIERSDGFRFIFLADTQLGCYATFSGFTDEQVEQYAAMGMRVEPVPAVTGFEWDAELRQAFLRGLSTEDAVNIIVNGFCKEVFRELPMEFAVEAQKLLSISLEGSVG